MVQWSYLVAMRPSVISARLSHGDSPLVRVGRVRAVAAQAALRHPVDAFYAWDQQTKPKQPYAIGSADAARPP